MFMVLEVVVVMLVCICIGVVYIIVFGGFLLEVLVGCIIDLNVKLVIIVDEGVCGGCVVFLKKNVDEVLCNLEVKNISKVMVFKCIGGNVVWYEYCDIWWYEVIVKVFDNCLLEEMKVEDLLFIFYIFGLTGKLKGVLYIIGGYLVYVIMIFKYVFDY